MLPLLCPPGPPSRRRSAFTLIELMVAMFLLAILAGLGVYVVMNINADAGAPRGAVLLQQSLMIAKQTALRSQRPTGVRLTVTAGSTLVTDLQFIQQPDDFAVQANNPASGVPFVGITTTGNLGVVSLVGQAPFGNFNGNVQAGDYLVVNDGLPHRITITPTAATGNQLTLASQLPAALPATGTSNYRVIRSPRPTGEDPIQLPLNIAIDIQTNTTFTQPLPLDTFNTPNTIDIVFSPSGAVVSRGLSSADALYLWVRDTTLAAPPTTWPPPAGQSLQGDQTILAVYTRTGLVAAQPVNQTTADPYLFTKDGLATGN